jgi:hypothetical protein
VKLPGSPRSTFWRYHTGGVADEGVCTIEALHLLLRALAGARVRGRGRGGVRGGPGAARRAAARRRRRPGEEHVLASKS